MKQVVILVAVILVSSYSFATPLSSSLNSTSRLQALSSAWHTQQLAQPKQIKNDITMVYGGADISRRPTLVPHITTS